MDGWMDRWTPGWRGLYLYIYLLNDFLTLEDTCRYVYWMEHCASGVVAAASVATTFHTHHIVYPHNMSLVVGGT